MPNKQYEFISQTGRVLLKLRELLLQGEFSCGERLSELPLVSRLNASRTPIRLALERLAHEGLLEPSASGGFLVRAFTIHDIWDAIEMRGVLEGTAARLAAERLGDLSELTAIRECQSKMDSITSNTPESFAHYMDLNEDFHRDLVTLSKSPMLERTLSHLTILPFAAPSSMVFARLKAAHAPELTMLGREQHHGIIDAIATRQGTRAEALAREHVQLARRNLQSVLSKDNPLTGMPGAPLIQLDPAV
jgi:GntR family transcriptional regulator of vanillate catabolism